jgi:pyrimidine operon attenuation protein/uracil phosphoribosyltransferase
MAKKKNRIKTGAELESSIKRIALQIYENAIEESEIVLIGVAPRGQELAEKIEQALHLFSDLKLVNGVITLNKKKPLDGAHCSLSLEQVANKSLVIVDDVLNTGSTLIYAVHHFLQVPVKQIKTAVMVNRNHKKYPIKADFKGLSLSTSVNEHISVILKGKESGIYLS